MAPGFAGPDFEGGGLGGGEEGGAEEEGFGALGYEVQGGLLGRRVVEGRWEDVVVGVGGGRRVWYGMFGHGELGGWEVEVFRMWKS